MKTQVLFLNICAVMVLASKQNCLELSAGKSLYLFEECLSRSVYGARTKAEDKPIFYTCNLSMESIIYLRSQTEFIFVLLRLFICFVFCCLRLFRTLQFLLLRNQRRRYEVIFSPGFVPYNSSSKNRANQVVNSGIQNTKIA